MPIEEFHGLLKKCFALYRSIVAAYHLKTLLCDSGAFWYLFYASHSRGPIIFIYVLSVVITVSVIYRVAYRVTPTLAKRIFWVKPRSNKQLKRNEAIRCHIIAHFLLKIAQADWQSLKRCPIFATVIIVSIIIYTRQNSGIIDAVLVPKDLKQHFAGTIIKSALSTRNETRLRLAAANFSA